MDIKKLLTLGLGGRSSVPAEATPDPTQKAGVGGLPIKRISLPDDLNLLNLLQGNMYSYVTPRQWPLEIYALIENLTLNNPDLRQAVDHIIKLGNTGHTISIEADPSSSAAIDAAVSRIEDVSEYIYPYATGPDGLINALFGQIARMGATSSEWVPKVDLSGIDKVFQVPVRQIRWVPRADLMGYTPAQAPTSGVLATGILSQRAFPLVALNPRTFYYANLETLEGSPYAIPPLIAALEPIAMQRAMIKNIHRVIKKLGIMGLCSYKVEPPAAHPGENEAVYQSRCLAYLQEITAQIKDSFADGIAAGFKGAFEFEVNGVTGDARGIADIFKMNEEQLFSAISADPAMHGRTYSTTETYASVVYSKMISQLTTVQKMVACVLKFGWGLDLLLAGIPVGLCVDFKASNALSNLQESQARMIDIANAAALYQEGIVDQQQKAQLLGYEQAALDAPLPDPSLAGDKNLDQRPKTGGGTDNTTKNPKKKQPKEQSKRSHQLVKFEYHSFMKKYYPVRDVAIIDTLVATLDDKKIDPAMAEKYRRYLQRSSPAAE